MDADEFAARERKGRKDYSLSASTAFTRSTFNHHLGDQSEVSPQRSKHAFTIRAGESH